MINISQMSIFLVTLAFGCGSSAHSNLNIIGGQKAPNDKAVRGDYPATIGFLTSNANLCSGTRIGHTTFISAAHCFKGTSNGTYLTMFASNSKEFNLMISNLHFHPTWAGNEKYKSDIAVFSVLYVTVDQSVDFDSLVDIASLSTRVPSIGMAVNLAGYGCAEKTGLGSSECDVKTGFKYMKTAHNKIIDDNALFSPDNHRSFQLDGSSNKEGIDGFIEVGDSGGPVYTTSRELLGVNTASNNGIMTGNDGIGIWTEHAWIGYDDVKSWLSAALAAESKIPKYLPDGSRITYTYRNGDFYGGSAKNGLRNGQGTIRYSDGRVYSGSWVNDKRSGYGEQTWPSGSMYVSYKGEWDNDVVHGKGTMVYTNGMIYSGQYTNGKIHGEGQMTYQNGDVRTGKFFNSKREGEFVLVTKAGNRYQEQFTNDVRISHEKIN